MLPQATRREERLDRLLHALSDGTRRALLKRLAMGPAMVTELATPFTMTRIAVAKHLRVLEGAGLVSRNIEGRIHRCTINPRPLQELETWLSSYREFWAGSLESLANFVEERARGPRRKK
jgi:DNA-binding transcriptional ArsR family regulator